MHIGFILLIIIVSGFFGKKKPLLGSFLGCIIALAQYFYFNDFQIKSFVIVVLIGFGFSFGIAYLISYLSSGLRGGKHNTGPSIIGGGRAGGSPGRIIQSDEEIESHKKK